MFYMAISVFNKYFFKNYLRLLTLLEEYLSLFEFFFFTQKFIDLSDIVQFLMPILVVPFSSLGFIYIARSI